MADEGVDFGDNVDLATFEQILEMDDGEDEGGHEFSKSIVFGFLEQAEQTFEKMDGLIESKDLEGLSALGHFLKGSSATLGFNHIKDECEKIQHYGHRKDATGTEDEHNDDLSLRRIKDSVQIAKKEFETVSALMREYYAKLEE